MLGVGPLSGVLAAGPPCGDLSAGTELVCHLYSSEGKESVADHLGGWKCGLVVAATPHLRVALEMQNIPWRMLSD